MRYCTKCGKQLNDGETCLCGQKTTLTKVKTIFSKLGDGMNAAEDRLNFCERNMKIVPDCISTNEGEISIKQYDLAILRSRIRGQYAEGRLQVTNKRIIFRATGASTLGKTIIQSEFDVNEISGVELKKSNRISLLNILGGIFLTLIISPIFTTIFEAIYDFSEFLSTIIAIALSVGCVFIFATLKKKGWLKLAVLSGGLGALTGAAGISTDILDIVFDFKLYSVINIFIFAVAIVWLIALLRISFVPDLTFYIKTKSASNVFEIKRRVWGILNLSKNEYTGFSEVLPWKDTDLAAQELGSLIDDLQTMGDLAIEKWRNN